MRSKGFLKIQWQPDERTLIFGAIHMYTVVGLFFNNRWIYLQITLEAEIMNTLTSIINTNHTNLGFLDFL